MAKFNQHRAFYRDLQKEVPIVQKISLKRAHDAIDREPFLDNPHKFASKALKHKSFHAFSFAYMKPPHGKPLTDLLLMFKLRKPLQYFFANHLIVDAIWNTGTKFSDYKKDMTWLIILRDLDKDVIDYAYDLVKRLGYGPDFKKVSEEIEVRRWRALPSQAQTCKRTRHMVLGKRDLVNRRVS